MSSPISQLRQELLEIVTRAVAKLNLEWLDEKRQVTQSKLVDAV